LDELTNDDLMSRSEIGSMSLPPVL
jgi:hypothetical protein